MSDEWCEGMLLKDFLAGYSPMEDAPNRKTRANAGSVRSSSSIKHQFSAYTPPKIERSELVELVA